MTDIYNSFSQIKGLTWIEHYENIIAWEKGEAQLLPPVGASIDLTTACNLRCRGCNAARSLKMGHLLSLDEVKKVIDMLFDWREEYGGLNSPHLRSICFGGGGEPSLHPHYDEIITYAHEKGFQIGTSTNGMGLMNKDIRTAIINHTEFCGVSVNAATAKTWSDYARRDEHNWKVLIKGMELLIKEWKETKREPRKADIPFKFLITEYNQHEILAAVKLAKEMGFADCFVRPAAIERFEIFDGKNHKFNMDSINQQLIEAKKLEDDNFKVYTSTSRVDAEYKSIHRFKDCHATPLLFQLCSDGNIYHCIDQRHLEYAKLTNWSNAREYWGSKEHLAHIKSINVKKNCPRCAAGNYNEQIEKTVLTDQIYRWFP